MGQGAPRSAEQEITNTILCVWEWRHLDNAPREVKVPVHRRMKERESSEHEQLCQARPDTPAAMHQARLETFTCAKAWTPGWDTCLKKEAFVGVPLAQGLLHVVDAGGMLGIGNLMQQLFAQQSLVVVDRLYKSTPRLDPVVAGDNGESPSCVVVTFKQPAQKSPELARYLPRVNLISSIKPT